MLSRRLLLCLLTLLQALTVCFGQETASADSRWVVSQDDSLLAAKPLLSADSAAPRRRLPLLRRIVRGFDRLDTTFIEPQHYTYTLMMQLTHTYDIYTLSAGNGAQTVTFAPDIKMKVGPYVGWRWFFFGYTFQVKDVSLNHLKQEVDLSIYSSQIGIDLFYRRTGSDYKLRNAYLGDRYADVARRLNGVPFDGLRAGITGLNVYYIFNHGRFSYPAAFSQSTQQKVSCGSWMAGIGYTKNSLDLDHNRLQEVVDERCGSDVPLDSGLLFHRVRYNDINLSVGYAYNWVLTRHLLLAGSLQGALAYKKSRGDVALDNQQGFSFENVNLNGIGRFGLVYNNGRWYSGMSVIVRSNNYHKSRFSANNTFGSLNVYVGYNFGLKRKYRRQL